MTEKGIFGLFTKPSILMADPPAGFKSGGGAGIAELQRRGCICPPGFPRHVTLPSNFTKKFDSARRLQLA